MELVQSGVRRPDQAKAAIVWTVFRGPWRAAHWLDGRLATQKDALPVAFAVSIQVDYNQLLRRITGRRNCPVCQTIYNIYSKPPQRAGFCDVEGAPLVQRSDDTEKVFAERMRAYAAQTTPVMERYREQGRFAEVAGDRRSPTMRLELLPPSSDCAVSEPRERVVVAKARLMTWLLY